MSIFAKVGDVTGQHLFIVRDGPLENLWGGGGASKVQKKYSRKGKLNEKNSCTPINPKKYSCYCVKKFTQVDNEKKLLRLENSPPPHNFSKGPSLTKSHNGTYAQNSDVSLPHAPHWLGVASV